MGTVFAEITLKNAADEENAREGLIREDEIRSVTVTSIVDTGAATLVINEKLCGMLGVGIREEKSVNLADGNRVMGKLTAPVDVIWKDRSWACPAVVIPGAETVLLGAIPLEGMDLMINTKAQELVGVHGDTVEYMAF